MTKEIRCANCGCPPHAGRPCENTFTLMVGPAGVATECACSTYEPLEPPDEKQCQCMITPAHSPFAFGPRPKPQRCKNPTAFIATEPPVNGKVQGSMGVCDTCVEELKKQMPDVILVCTCTDYKPQEKQRPKRATKGD